MRSGSTPARRLLLALHYLVVDGVYWGVLLPDLAAAWRAVRAAEPMAVPPTGTSLRAWATALEDRAHDRTRVAGLRYWREVLSTGQPLPATTALATAAAVEKERAAGTGQLTAVLPSRGRRTAAAHGARRLLRPRQTTSCSPAPRCRPGVRVVVTWRATAATRPCYRAPTCPVPSAGSPASTQCRWAPRTPPRPRRRPSGASRSCCARPDGGVGHGLLRYVNPATAELLGQLERPQIGFNCLGRAGAPAAPGADWAPAPDRGAA